MKIRPRYWGFFLFLCFFVWLPTETEAAPVEIPEDYNLNELQDTFDSLIGQEYEFSFEKYFEDVMNGKEIISLEGILTEALHILSEQWETGKDDLLRLILLGLLAGVFCNFSDTLGRKETGETGFFIVYILLFTILTAAFFTMINLAEEVLGNLLIFMKALIPSLSLTLAASTGSATSMGFYQITLIGMTLVEFILLNFMIPAVSIYFMLALANQLTHDNGRFTKLADLIHTFLRWSMKTLLAFIVGFQGIQMLLLPVMDQVKRNVVMKTAGSVPGIGNTMNAVAETVLGSAILLKSVIGIGGIIGLCIVCAYPMIKMFVFIMMYRISAAIVQPISDKRIVQSLHVTSESGRLLLSIVFISLLLFLFSIIIVISMTRV
ncbi:MAG: stage III sporulation protein AE [Lachnoclostridium sp.]|jgi:stage III sporulation protein AE|nr:stage III sporulation protein AE [Lachnoclostridium sp.]